MTLRNLPPEISRLVRAQAEKKGLSLNKAIIGLLEEIARPATRKPKKALHHDLDALAGSWSRQEAKEFEKVIGLQRTIDSELWP